MIFIVNILKHYQEKKYLMNFKEEFHPKIKADLKKLDKSVINDIKTIHLDKIVKNPFNNEKLQGDLKSLYSYHFRKNSVDYRIAYEVYENTIIFYIMIAKRENFYKNIKQRKKGK